MTTAVVTGSASGIGAAVRRRLERDGTRVIGIDVRGAEIEVDLSTPEGRSRACAQATERSGGRLDRLVACAGIGPHVREPARIAAVNFFGCVEVLDGLLPALRHGEAPAALAIASNSASMGGLDEHPYVLALLEHDEPRARREAESIDSTLAYLGSKHALVRAVRRRAQAWGRAGVRLNAIAPGPVRTPLLQGGLDDPELSGAIRALAPPLGRFGEPEEIAELVAVLIGERAGWLHGAVLFVDGGIDATLRPDRF